VGNHKPEKKGLRRVGEPKIFERETDPWGSRSVDRADDISQQGKEKERGTVRWMLNGCDHLHEQTMREKVSGQRNRGDKKSEILRPRSKRRSV